jgi:hemerythrin
MLGWKKSYSLGNDAIDHDHKFIIQTINDIKERINSGKKVEEIEQIINELRDYSIDHFSREEKLMELVQYVDLNEHVVLHQTFIYRIDSLLKLKMARVEDLTIMKDSFTFLYDWFVQHIQMEDKLMVQFQKVNSGSL